MVDQGHRFPPPRPIQERGEDWALSSRQKDGMDIAEDPSRYNAVLTVRHGIRLIAQQIAAIKTPTPLVAPPTGLNAFSLVALNRISPGEMVEADQGIAGKREVFGIVDIPVAPSVSAPVIIFGEITNLLWSWTPGLPLFAGNAGQMTHTAPATGYLQKVGIAITPIRILFHVDKQYVFRS